MVTLFLTTPYQPLYILKTNCPILTHSLFLKYGNYLTTVPMYTQNVIVISKKLVTEISKYDITHNEIYLTTSHPLQAIEEILHAHRTFPPNIFALHGAAIEHNHQAYLFLAPTTTGKTTLTSYLTTQGFGYITDDCVLLDRETFTIHPYTTPLHLRSGGVTVLKEYNALPVTLEYLDDPTFQRYVYTPDNCITDSLPLGRIFFITRTKHDNHIEEMNGTQRMTALLKSPIIEYPLTSEYMQFIARLSKVPCNQLFYCDMNYVTEVIKNG